MVGYDLTHGNLARTSLIERNSRRLHLANNKLSAASNIKHTHVRRLYLYNNITLLRRL
jgi:hypothetical protein